MSRRPNYPNATDMHDIQNRNKQLKENDAFPTVRDTTVAIREISTLFSAKSMTPENWTIASLSGLTSLCLSGSKVKVNAGHSCGTSEWYMIVGISSSRKGCVSSFYAKHVAALNPLFRKYITSDFLITIDGATLPAIQKQTQTNKGTLAVIYEEVGEFVKQFKLYDNDGLRGKLLCIYDGRGWTMNYKGKDNIYIPSAYFTLFINAQYKTGTDFLNTFQEEGLAPRICTIYHSEVPYTSSKQQDEAAEKWLNSGMDTIIHQSCKQLTYRFAIPHLQSDNKVEFHHEVSEDAKDLCHDMRDYCMKQCIRNQHNNPPLASMYGKMPDKAIKTSLLWTALEESINNVREGRLLDKPLTEYSEIELQQIDPRIRSQKIYISRESLKQAVVWVEKNLLVDLAIRKGYFPLKNNHLIPDIEKTFVATYLSKMGCKIISTTYVHQWKRLNVEGGSGRSSAKVVQKLHELLSEMNIGYQLMNGDYFLLHDIAKMQNAESIAEVLKGFQYIGLTEDDYNEIMKINGADLKSIVANCFERTVVASKIGAAKKKDPNIPIEQLQNLRVAANIIFDGVWSELLQHSESDKSEFIQSNSTTVAPTHPKLSTTFPTNLNGYYQNWYDKIRQNVNDSITTNSSIVSGFGSTMSSTNNSSQFGSLFDPSISTTRQNSIISSMSSNSTIPSTINASSSSDDDDYTMMARPRKRRKIEQNVSL